MEQRHKHNPQMLLVCRNRQGWIPGILRPVAHINIIHDAFHCTKSNIGFLGQTPELKAYFRFYDRQFGNALLHGGGKIQNLLKNVSLNTRNMRRVLTFKTIGLRTQNILCHPQL